MASLRNLLTRVISFCVSCMRQLKKGSFFMGYQPSAPSISFHYRCPCVQANNKGGYFYHPSWDESPEMSGHSSSFGICIFSFLYGSGISSIPSGFFFFLFDRERHGSTFSTCTLFQCVIFRTIDLWTRSLLNNGRPLCIIERLQIPFVETAKGADVTARPRDFASQPGAATGKQ